MSGKDQYNFECKVVVTTSSGELTYHYGKFSDFVEIHFSVPFSNDTDKNVSEITIYNIEKGDFERIHKGDNVKLYAGYSGDVGLLVSGTIYRTTVPTLEDADTAYVLRVIEGDDYSKKAKQHLTFAKNTPASTIIKKVASQAGIKLNYVSLKTNKKYKDGFTAEDHPMDTLEQVADDCKTSLFYLRGKLTLRYVFDGGDYDQFNLNYDTGLLESPTREDRDEDWEDSDDDDGLGKYSWSVDSILNYHLTTYAHVTIKTEYINETVRVINGEHSFDGEQPTTSFEAVTK